MLSCLGGVTACGGVSLTKTGAFSVLFSIEVPVPMLSLQTRGSQGDAHPLFRCGVKPAWAPAAAWPLPGPLLLLCTQRVLEPKCKGDIAPSDGKVGLKGIVNESEVRDKKTTAGEEGAMCFRLPWLEQPWEGSSTQSKDQANCADHLFIPHCEIHFGTQLSLQSSFSRHHF